MSFDDLKKRARDELREVGLERAADRLVDLALPCIRLATAKTDDAAIAIARSKLGGSPDMPADLVWPTWDDVPLAFLGQIQLSDLDRLQPLPTTLPRSGMLLFFYDAQQTTWGFDPKDEGSWKVFYSAEPAASLARREPPADLPDGGLYDACSLAFSEAISLPSWANPAVRALQLSDREFDIYSDLTERTEDEAARHQMGGHAIPIQDEMQLDCQLVSHGIYLGDPSGYEDPRAEQLEPGAADWRLLLQLDSDENAAMMWGDLGMLYFWIPQPALEAAAFDKVWMMLQCH